MQVLLDKYPARVYIASMIKIVPFLALVLLTAPAHAAQDVLPPNWQAIVKTEDEQTLYLDTSDIGQTESGTHWFWLIALVETAPHEKGQYELDCKKGLFTLHSRIFLETVLDETGAEMIKEPKRITVKPSTSINIIRKRVCESRSVPAVLETQSGSLNDPESSKILINFSAHLPPQLTNSP